MPSIADKSLKLCTRRLRVTYGPSHIPQHDALRLFSTAFRLPQAQQNTVRKNDSNEEEEEGAMSRRLTDLSEEALEKGGRGARKAVEEAGFDEAMKRKLEDHLVNTRFREEHRGALAQAEMSVSAGKGSRDIAGAQPWTGEESVEDAALRMLVDTHKPMRGPARIPSAKGPPPRVDTGRSKNKASSGTRLASARDKTSYYAFMKDPGMSEKEREQMRKELKERFAPAARAVPATIQGLASLANERIEDAIARGQFKNLPRGKKVERDYNASSPFIDTTVRPFS